MKELISCPELIIEDYCLINGLGNGLLVGYNIIKINNIEKHVYYVLNCNKSVSSGFSNDCDIITIIQEKQTLEKICPQRVTFDVISQNVGGKIKNIFINIKVDKE